MTASKKMSTTLLFGLMAAAVMMLFVFGTYRAGPQTFLSWTAYLGWIIVIVLAVSAAVLGKRAKGGLLDFRAALKISFGVLVLAIFGHAFFTWLLLNVIDPHFKQTLMPLVLQNIEKTYRNFGVPEDDIRRALDAEQGQDQFTPGRMLSGMGRLIIIGFLIAVVIALIVKSKKEPLPNPGL